MGNVKNILSFINFIIHFTIGKNLDYLSITSKNVKKLHKQIASNVKRIRKEKNITQLELALTIGHQTMSTIGKIESGHENKHYNVEQLFKISKALDVSILSLFDGVDEI